MNDSDLLKELIALRREIHAHPELGNREFKTAQVIERVLRSLNIPHKRVTPTGIVATLKNGAPASLIPSFTKEAGIISSDSHEGSFKVSEGTPCVALRADMDALPLTEKTGKPYASKIHGVMHACGHDAHVAMLLGAARLLKERPLGGTVKFFFQPNEEGAGGALDLIKKGAMKNPRVQATFGLHVNPRFPSGTVAIKAGPLMAAVDRFEIEIFGQGGHAAYPHEGADALLIATELVQALQTIVSRKVDPVEPAVLTVGTLNSGTRYNILAASAVLTGTVRTLSEKTHARIPKLIRQITEGVTRAHGGKFRLDYETVGSVLCNDKTMADLARRTTVNLLGKEKVLEPDLPSMGGEDFSEYLRHAPGCFIYVGTGNPRTQNLIPWHHPQFDLDESALPVGARVLAAVAEGFIADVCG